MMGAYFGPEGVSEGYTSANPKGYWERRDVNRLNESLLEYNGCTWNRLDAWPENALPALVPQQEKTIRNLLLNMDAHRPWVMKDPRLCLTLPYWMPFLEVPVAVMVYRNPLEIAHSLVQRDNMPPAVAIALWEYHVVNMLNATLNIPRIFVRHAPALQSPVRFVKALYETLEEQLDVRGLRLPSDREIRAFVDKKLHRSRASEVADKIALTPFQTMLISILEQAAPHKAKLSVSAASIVTMREYCRATRA